MACLNTILLSASAGLLFHGMLMRPELLCAWFGNILAVIFVWKAVSHPSGLMKNTLLWLSGICCGLATLGKIPGICYLGVVISWCMIAPILDGKQKQKHPSQISFWIILFPLLTGLSNLFLLSHLTVIYNDLSPIVLTRLRAAAVIVSIAPILLYIPVQNRLLAFLIQRFKEITILASGTLSVIPLTYVFLRYFVMKTGAAEYIVGTIHFVMNPSPQIASIIRPESAMLEECLNFFYETPLLIITTIGFVILVCALRGISNQSKAAAVIMILTGLGMALVMSRRSFTDQYSILIEVPLILALSISIHAFSKWWRQRHPSPKQHWGAPIAFTTAFILVLSVYLRLEPKYSNYEDDRDLPVREFTVTFIYDHDAHSEAYRNVMKYHYTTRTEFMNALNLYLAEPRNRY